MYTGIVQAKAPIGVCKLEEGVLRYAVAFPPELLEGLVRGASVSVDGVCQTIVDIQKNLVWFEAIEETLRRTTLNQIGMDSEVNLERSAKIGDEIGGHPLSGHIYGTASIASIEKNVYTLSCPSSWMKYLFSKGFVALNGVSLTLVDTCRQTGQFTVHLIPETLKRTTFEQKKVGDLVNLEIDATTQATVETVTFFLENQVGRP